MPRKPGSEIEFFQLSESHISANLYWTPFFLLSRTTLLMLFFSLSRTVADDDLAHSVRTAMTMLREVEKRYGKQ